MMPLGLPSLVLPPSSSASLSALASSSESKRPSQCVRANREQQRPRRKARSSDSKETRSLLLPSLLSFLPLSCLAAPERDSRAPRPRAPGPSLCSLFRRQERARDAFEAPARSDHRGHRPEGPAGEAARREGNALDWHQSKKTTKKKAAAVRQRRAARRFRQHPLSLPPASAHLLFHFFLSFLVPFLLLSRSSSRRPSTRPTSRTTRQLARYEEDREREGFLHLFFSPFFSFLVSLSLT